MEAATVDVAVLEKTAGKEGVKLASDLEAKCRDAINAFAGPDDQKAYAAQLVLGAKLLDREPPSDG